MKEFLFNLWRAARASASPSLLRGIQGQDDPAAIGFKPRIEQPAWQNDDWEVSRGGPRIPWTHWPELELDDMREIRP